MIRKILGPPGTGKTTKLLHYVEQPVSFAHHYIRKGIFPLLKKLQERLEEECWINILS